MSTPFQPRAFTEELPCVDTLLLALVNASPAVLYSCNVSADCGTIAVTDNVRALLGYAAAEFIDDPSFWAVRVHPDDSARVFAEMPLLIREGAQTIEYRFRHADGSYRWLRDQMRLEKDSAGRPLRILGCWLDITAERHTARLPKIILSRQPTTTTTTNNRGGNYAKQT
jgi:PAS domain S-box-containing protein